MKKYYESIDTMPMYLWKKIYKDVSLLPLSKTGVICRRAEDVFTKLSDEIVDRFGINENYKKILANNLRIEYHRLNLQRTGDRINLVHIKIYQQKNKRLQERHKESDLQKSVFFFQQKNINTTYKTITISEYFTAQDFIQEQVQAEKAAITKAHK